MSQILKFKVRDDKGVEATLREALDVGFDEILVVGIKGGELYSCKSANASTLAWLGYLEYLRMWIYNKMSGIE